MTTPTASAEEIEDLRRLVSSRRAGIEKDLRRGSIDSFEEGASWATIGPVPFQLLSAILATLDATASDLAAEKAENARLRGTMEWLAGEIEGERNLITHPNGRRAHHIDSQDEIRVEVLTALLACARTALEASHER